jgi:hypothetical protein
MAPTYCADALRALHPTSPFNGCLQTRTESTKPVPQPAASSIHRYQSRVAQASSLTISALDREQAKNITEASLVAEADGWRAARWQAAFQAMADRRHLQGCTTDPLPSHPHPGRPVSSAEQLQQLTEMESLPETTETSQIDYDGVETKRVIICDVSFEEMEKMKDGKL